MAEKQIGSDGSTGAEIKEMDPSHVLLALHSGKNRTEALRFLSALSTKLVEDLDNGFALTPHEETVEKMFSGDSRREWTSRRCLEVSDQIRKLEIDESLKEMICRRIGIILSDEYSQKYAGQEILDEMELKVV